MVQKNGYTDARVRYHLSGSEIGIVNLKTQWTGTIKVGWKILWFVVMFSEERTTTDSFTVFNYIL